jgi:hypothetical protein
MKLSSKLARLKLQKAKETASVPSEARTKGAVRNWIALIVCLLFAAGGTWAVLEIFVWHKLPPALVGAWEVQGGPMQGGTFEFLGDGTLTIRTNHGPDVKARAAVDGKTLATTITAAQNPGMLRDETRKSTIRELTPNSLVLELERGDVLKMARKK